MMKRLVLIVIAFLLAGVVQVRGETLKFEIVGGEIVNRDTLVRLEKLLEPHRDDRLPLTVVLDSPGGYVKWGFEIVDLFVRERSSGRPITTFVGEGRACESACVVIYMAGYPRRAAPGASFMIHAPRDERNGSISLKTSLGMFNRLIGLGVSPEWLDPIRELVSSGRGEYREIAKNLYGSGIVTELVISTALVAVTNP